VQVRIEQYADGSIDILYNYDGTLVDGGFTSWDDAIGWCKYHEYSIVGIKFK
jgi:hypothetical protein